jgi:hypothetical protein
LSFGLNNAPATFHSVMNAMFAPLVNKCVVVYLDDILIYSRTEEEHLAHLKQVLQILRENHFYAKLKKCTFFQPETLFLGHVVGRDGIKPDPAKVTAVKGWPVPQTVTDVRSFLGLTNYFRRFIQGYAQITRPLTDLTRKDMPFAWSPDCQAAFDRLKFALTSAPVLQPPDFDKPFVVVSDAIGFAAGAVLLQDDKPLAGRCRLRRGTMVVENRSCWPWFMRCKCGAVYWRDPLQSTAVLVTIDHHPNTFLQTQVTLCRRRARWSRHGGNPGSTVRVGPLCV